MWLDGIHISTSVASCEFEPLTDGTRLTHTEHGILDGFDDGHRREAGRKGPPRQAGSILSNHAWASG